MQQQKERGEKMHKTGTKLRAQMIVPKNISLPLQDCLADRKLLRQSNSAQKRNGCRTRAELLRKAIDYVDKNRIML